MGGSDWTCDRNSVASRMHPEPREQSPSRKTAANDRNSCVLLYSFLMWRPLSFFPLKLSNLFARYEPFDLCQDIFFSRNSVADPDDAFV